MRFLNTKNTSWPRMNRDMRFNRLLSSSRRFVDGLAGRNLAFGQSCFSKKKRRNFATPVELVFPFSGAPRMARDRRADKKFTENKYFFDNRVFVYANSAWLRQNHSFPAKLVVQHEKAVSAPIFSRGSGIITALTASQPAKFTAPDLSYNLSPNLQISTLSLARMATVSTLGDEPFKHHPQAEREASFSQSSSGLWAHLESSPARPLILNKSKDSETRRASALSDQVSAGKRAARTETRFLTRKERFSKNVSGRIGFAYKGFMPGLDSGKPGRLFPAAPVGMMQNSRSLIQAKFKLAEKVRGQPGAIANDGSPLQFYAGASHDQGLEMHVFPVFSDKGGRAATATGAPEFELSYLDPKVFSTPRKETNDVSLAPEMIPREGTRETQKTRAAASEAAPILSALDIGRITDQVQRAIEQKMRLENERSGQWY